MRLDRFADKLQRKSDRGISGCRDGDYLITGGNVRPRMKSAAPSAQHCRSEHGEHRRRTSVAQAAEQRQQLVAGLLAADTVDQLFLAVAPDI